MPDTPPPPDSILIAEIGSLITRVTLVDTVDGEHRMIGRAEVPSSLEPPHQNALFGILEAAAQISETIGRQLLHEGQLLMPQNNERDGVDRLICVTSATGTLALVVTAIASDVSARSALHACRSTYTSILQVITLDDAMMRSSGGGASWIVRQIQAMLSLEPDAVFIAGGLEGGATDALHRLAHIVGLTALRTSVDASGQQSQNLMARPVIYAGNSDARDQVVEALSGRAETLVVDNVRPSLTQERLEPAREALSRLYDERILTRLPGLPALRRLCHVPVTTVCNMSGLMTRFIAERNSRKVLTLDVGAAGSSAFHAGPGSYTLSILGACGTAYGITTLLKERGVANIARWLPFPISEADLTHWLLNKLLRPQMLPASREDVFIEQAVTREVLALLLETLTDEDPDLDYDLVIAGGGVLAHAPHPGMAALMLLDVLQPTTGESLLALDLHLDILGLLPACGMLAKLNPDAAVTLFERDLLRNVPLATCVVPLGEGKPGEVAVEAELTSRRGKSRRVTVRHGQIARLRLDQSSSGQLTLRPASNVRIGQNEPGAEVQTDIAAIKGSALGVVIDARGRPLRLPEDATQRCAQIWEWLVALGAAQAPSPYVDAAIAAPVVDEQVGAAWPAPLRSVNGRTGAPVAEPVEPAQPEPAMPPLPEQPGAEMPPVDQPAAPMMEQPPATAETPETTRLKPGKRISLGDLAAEEEQPESPPPPQPVDLPEPAAETTTSEEKIKPGKRISLSDLAAQEEQPPPQPVDLPEPAAEITTSEEKVRPGKRISLSELAAQEESRQSQAPPEREPEPESDEIQNDLAKLRQSVEEPKRGWFRRKK
jgi:hypothetical protein